MPRDLGDVLHLFAPELAAPAERVGADDAGVDPPPLIGVVFARPDPVPSALLWNLAVELARQGAGAALVAPSALAGPAARDVVLGVEVERVDAGPAALALRAERALLHAAPSGRGFVIAPFPAGWLAKAGEVAPLLRWTLVLARPDEASLRGAAEALAAIATESPHARLGVTVYGVRTLGEARDCFEHLALAVERRFGLALTSYGVLVDDVHLSRSIVTGRPVALASPHSAAARALADVASLLLADA
jgi:hypothetical protein